MEEYELMKQAKYRGYMSNIDKTLKNFEYSSEWPDLISALGKLNKVITSYTQYKIIPRRIKISKRLAQCMHPALPSGVHLKALETYDVIFSNTGVERLASELFIYSAGLFPLLGYAAMSVRPALLGIYEKYFVPLGERLRPALSGFLSGVLPGYESGLDHFERTNTLLGKVCETVNPIYFYSCLWECVATNASVRLPALSYLIDHFNKKLGMEGQPYVMGKNKQVMMSGLCACLNDSIILVQRNTLEFLLIGFPMHTNLIDNSDLIKLVTNGLNTILRRDMSLNRRLYAWLLGSEVANKSQIIENSLSSTSATKKDKESYLNETYFNKYSKQVLIKALKNTLKASLQSTPVELSPYRILISLLDKVEIGPVVLDDVLFDVIRTMSVSSGNIEVGKSANLLFATFDPAYVWNYMTNLYENSCKVTDDPSKNADLDKIAQPEPESVPPQLIEVCSLTEFLLETISLEMYNETTRVYLPKLFLSITQMLTTYSDNLTNEDVTASLKLCIKIVNRVQPMVTYNPIELDDKNSLNESLSSKANIKSTLDGNLEKSKSDSKLNQTLLDDEEPMKRSSSNQSMSKKNTKKNKKSKSYTKLLEIEKELNTDTGQMLFNSDSALSTPNLELTGVQIKNKSTKNSKQKSPKAKLKNRLDEVESDVTNDIENCEINRLSTDSTTSASTICSDSISVNDIGYKIEQQKTTMLEYSILEKCIKQYEIFYQVFVSKKLLCFTNKNPKQNSNFHKYQSVVTNDENILIDNDTTTTNEINKLFETLKITKNCRKGKLQSLLKKSMDSVNVNNENDGNHLTFLPRLINIDDNSMIENIQRLMKLKFNDQLREAIKLASNLLIEMSTFPNYNQKLIMDYSQYEIPSWLKVLSLIASYTKNDKELQITAISTLFELISLLKSQLEHSSNPGVTFVVMLPLLKFGHINYLETETRLFQVLTSTLWDYFGENDSDLRQINGLLHQLNNCLDSGLVETVINHRISCSHVEWDTIQSKVVKPKTYIKFNETSNHQRLIDYTSERLYDIKIMNISNKQPLLNSNEYILDNQVLGFKKFELLWHLGREIHGSKGFEKTLLKMFDKLSLPFHSAIRIYITKWLQECFVRGDLCRIIRPLLKIMLGSKSKKISVVHAKSLQKDDGGSSVDFLSNDNPEDDVVLGKDIYAVRNEDGNICYRVETTPNKKRSPIRSLQKKFFGVTMGNKNKSSNDIALIKTPTTSISSIDVTSTNDSNNISLIINPLDNSSDIDQQIDSNQVESVNDIEEQKGISFKEDLYSSGDDDDSISTSSDDSDSAKSNQNLSMGTENCIKRYVGTFNEVSDVLCEHDRTKNKKTYNLNHDVNKQGFHDDNSMEIPIHIDECYRSSLPSESVLENVVNDSINDIDGKIESDSYQTETNRSTSSNINKNPKLRRNRVKKIDKKSRHSTGNIIENKNKLVSNSESLKRLSCTSKLSIMSSSSNNSSNLSETRDSDTENYLNEIQNKIQEDKRSGNLESTDSMNSNDRNHEFAADKQIRWEKAREAFDKGKKNVEILRKNSERTISDEKIKNLNEKIHPFHTHMLLYLGVYDTKQVLYSFQTLRNIISCDCRAFLCLSVTTAVTNSDVKQLLIRQKKSISGKGFSGTIVNTEFSHAYRGCMYLEALVTICLYYCRAYFQKEIVSNEFPTVEDIHGNHQIQMASIELLTLLCTELITIIKDMGKALACYIADLMVKCKLQKIILHCVMLSVHALEKSSGMTYSEQILRFNNPANEKLHTESFQIQLLRLLLAIIKLEYEVIIQKMDDGTKNFTIIETNPSSHSPTRPSPSTPVNVKYLPNSLISQQPMFLAAILSALQSQNLKHLHRNWTDLVTSSLNCLNFGSITNIIISVVHQICANIDKITKSSKTIMQPPDYAVSQLEALTILCHFCLLDNSQQSSISYTFNQTYSQSNATTASTNPSHIFNNLVNGFLSSPNSNDNQTKNAQHMAARNAVLSHLPRIVASVATLWEHDIGQAHNVKHQLLEFLSPISLHHGINFLTAVSVAWQERGDIFRRFSNTKSDCITTTETANLTHSHKALPQASPEQMTLVKLVSSIRVMPIDSIVQTLHHVVKSPPPIHHPPAGLTLEVSALELFYFYMKGAPAPQLIDSWSALLPLLKDGLSLSPPAQFVLLIILNEFVQRCPQMPFQDKKDLRELHDITARLVEALSTVAGACLEQTTWLRRNLAVKEDFNSSNSDGLFREGNSIIGNQQYSVQAQSILAVILANLLDVAYGSQEKDKVIGIVITLMYNIIPYLKNHTTRNVPSFYACSHLLASLSGYQYTRKAWRKDLLDLLLDSSFFQMDISCLPFWKSILDSLMTYDNTTFRELMNRVSLAQTGSLNIFTSKEQEYEQRALLLKRLAFVIFCSELDQYHKYMPEIQEQLANSLRLPQVVPSVQAAVFLCFRVLLLRMSPDHVTSLWPIIIAEMVQVFLAIEQELLTDTEEYSQHIKMLSGLDTSWVTNSSNGLNAHGHPHWRMVQLETAKLLEMGCVLPATILPHFQMYRWAFVGGKYDENKCDNEQDTLGTSKSVTESKQFDQSMFIPHVTRIATLMDFRYKNNSAKNSISKSKNEYLVLKCQYISDIQDLYNFFSNVGTSWAINSGEIEKDIKNCLYEIENVLSCDFLEKMHTGVNTR